MTSFAHVDYPTEHPGVARVERAAESLKQLAKGFDGGRGAATLLLAAIVAAMLVVANQVIDTWTEGHLLAAWIVMWTIAFAGLALLAGPARAVVRRTRTLLRQSAQVRREAAEDRRMWEVALADARVMADISRAMGKQIGYNARYF